MRYGRMGRLGRALCGALVALFVAPAFGGAASSYSASVVSAETPTIVETAGVTGRMTFAVKAANDSWQGVLYRNASVVSGAATMSRLVRYTLFGIAAGALVDALIDHYTQSGFVVDPVNKSIGVPAQHGTYSGTSRQAFGCPGGDNGWHYSLASCVAGLMAAKASWNPSFSRWANGTCYWTSPQFQGEATNTCPAACIAPDGSYQWGFCAGTLPAGQSDGVNIPPEWLPYFPSEDTTKPGTLPDGQEWPSVAPLVTPDEARRLLIDPNGVPWWTPEVSAAADQAARDAATQAGQDPSTSVQAGPTPSVDPSVAPSAAPEPWTNSPSDAVAPSASGGAPQLPAFCSWVGQPICDWFGWTKQELTPVDGDPAVPSETLSPGSWNSGLSSGSCPAPVVVSALGASVPISWQPLCDLAAILRPLLIGLAGLSAALILLGQRAGGGGS